MDANQFISLVGCQPHGYSAADKYPGFRSRSVLCLGWSRHLNDYIRHHLLYGLYSNGRFVDDLRRITDPSVFEFPEAWVMFFALAQGQHYFLQKYGPHHAREEYLTGAFFEVFPAALEKWSEKFLYIYNRNPNVQMYLAETASGGPEVETGSDVGVIIHIKRPGNREYFRAASFQIKKGVEKSFVGDIAPNGELQLSNLLRHGPLGHYLFIQKIRGRPAFCARVRPAAEILDEVRATGSYHVDARSKCIDFAAYMAFALADPFLPYGRTFSKPQDALNTVLGSKTLSCPPKRVAIFQAGAGIRFDMWPELLANYPGIELRKDIAPKWDKYDPDIGDDGGFSMDMP